MHVRSMFRTVRIASALALVVALAALAGCATKVVSTTPGVTPDTVTATGSGKVSATPDIATMQFGVSVRATDAKKALDGASVAAEKITKALVAIGIDAKDIQTANVNVYPQMDYSKGREIPNGYEANISVTTTIRDLAKIGDTITAANSAGANTISGPGFGIDEDAKYRSEAIDDAVADARKSAEAMAKAAGKRLGEVVSVVGSDVNAPIPYGDYRTMTAKDAAAVPIEPGQLDVTANVTVVFELK